MIHLGIYGRFIKCLVFTLVALWLSHNSHGQRRLEAGPFLGVAYYNGDLNPQKQFYNIHPAIGGLLRYVLNDRLALKGTVTVASLSGSYPQADIYYPLNPGFGSQYVFERTIADFSGQIEFNLFSFDHVFKAKKTNFAPYLSVGLATTLYRQFKIEDDATTSENPHFILSLPLGIGVKWKPLDWLRVGAEWSFRKTSADDLDLMSIGAVNPGDPFGFNESSSVHNNDWYSMAGIYATFTLFRQRTRCNAGY